jgi:Type II restriction enzyme SfiI
VFLDPVTLAHDLDELEAIEKATLRLVTQALVEFGEAREIFNSEADLQADIGEDITREALERLGASGPRVRVSGKMDYKRVRFVFHPTYALRQALLVDSKAEEGAENVARIQTSQTSMHIRQVRSGEEFDVPGTIPTVLIRGDLSYLTTTVFVKYSYSCENAANHLHMIRTFCLPNGMLQDRYNADPRHGIWQAGPNAPTRGEAFRTRVNLPRLRTAAAWRVQEIPLDPAGPFHWKE